MNVALSCSPEVLLGGGWGGVKVRDFDLQTFGVS